MPDHRKGTSLPSMLRRWWHEWKGFLAALAYGTGCRGHDYSLLTALQAWYLSP